MVSSKTQTRCGSRKLLRTITIPLTSSLLRDLLVSWLLNLLLLIPTCRSHIGTVGLVVWIWRIGRWRCGYEYYFSIVGGVLVGHHSVTLYAIWLLLTRHRTYWPQSSIGPVLGIVLLALNFTILYLLGLMAICSWHHVVVTHILPPLLLIILSRGNDLLLVALALRLGHSGVVCSRRSGRAECLRRPYLVLLSIKAHHILLICQYRIRGLLALNHMILLLGAFSHIRSLPRRYGGGRLLCLLFDLTRGLLRLLVTLNRLGLRLLLVFAGVPVAVLVHLRIDFALLFLPASLRRFRDLGLCGSLRLLLLIRIWPILRRSCLLLLLCLLLVWLPWASRLNHIGHLQVCHGLLASGGLCCNLVLLLLFLFELLFLFVCLFLFLLRQFWVRFHDLHLRNRLLYTCLRPFNCNLLRSLHWVFAVLAFLGSLLLVCQICLW